MSLTCIHTFHFEDGRQASVRTDNGKTGWRQSSIDLVCGIDGVGDLVAEDPNLPGFFYVLTACCGASVKGIDGQGGGYCGCRRCYDEVEGGGLPCFRVIPLAGETLNAPIGDCIMFRDDAFDATAPEPPLKVISSHVAADGTAYQVVEPPPRTVRAS